MSWDDHIACYTSHIAHSKYNTWQKPTIIYTCWLCCWSVSYIRKSLDKWWLGGRSLRPIGFETSSILIFFFSNRMFSSQYFLYSILFPWVQWTSTFEWYWDIALEVIQLWSHLDLAPTHIKIINKTVAYDIWSLSTLVSNNSLLVPQASHHKSIYSRFKTQISLFYK